jgi:hypothetical protein
VLLIVFTEFCHSEEEPTSTIFYPSYRCNTSKFVYFILL